MFSLTQAFKEGTDHNKANHYVCGLFGAFVTSILFFVLVAYIAFFNEQRPAYSLNYLTPVLFRMSYAPTTGAL